MRFHKAETRLAAAPRDGFVFTPGSRRLGQNGRACSTSSLPPRVIKQRPRSLLLFSFQSCPKASKHLMQCKLRPWTNLLQAAVGGNPWGTRSWSQRCAGGLGSGKSGGPGGPSPRTCVPWRIKCSQMRSEPALRSWRKPLGFLLPKALSHRDLGVLAYIQHRV